MAQLAAGLEEKTLRERREKELMQEQQRTHSTRFPFKQP